MTPRDVTDNRRSRNIRRRQNCVYDWSKIDLTTSLGKNSVPERFRQSPGYNGR
jgi:hypothetical protein